MFIHACRMHAGSFKVHLCFASFLVLLVNKGIELWHSPFMRWREGGGGGEGTLSHAVL